MSATNISEFLNLKNTMIVDAVSTYGDFLRALEKLSSVQGSQRLYTAKELELIASGVLSGNLSFTCMTRTYGLRDKLRELVEDFHIYCSWCEE